MGKRSLDLFRQLKENVDSKSFDLNMEDGQANTCRHIVTLWDCEICEIVIMSLVPLTNPTQLQQIPGT